MTRKILFFAFCALALAACNKNSEDIAPEGKVLETKEAYDITPFTAKLASDVHITSKTLRFQPSMICSTDPNPDWDNNISYSIYETVTDAQGDTLAVNYHYGGLKPATTYYYRAYAEYRYLNTDKEAYGEIKSFTTPDIVDPVATEQPIVGTYSVLLRGRISEDMVGADCDFWFLYGKEGVLREEKIPAIRDGYIFEAVYQGGSTGTVYIYRAGLTFDGKDYLGDIVDVNFREFVPSEGEQIDMGLSVKWSSHNVGATKPSEYGDYFAWGETAAKEEYTEETYSYSTNHPEILPLSNDAARVNMGGSWRMPTREDFEELNFNTFVEWARYNETDGLMFISKKNGERIFFPAAGYKGLEGFIDHEVGGYYWSSTRHDSWNDAYFLEYYKLDRLGVNNATRRSDGFPVRAVCE